MFNVARILAPVPQWIRAALSRLPATLGLVFLLCIPILFVVTIHQSTDQRLLVPGEPAPVLILGNINSNEVHNVDLRGHPHAILFFGAECPHCQRELSHFDQIEKVYSNRVKFLAVSQSEDLKTSELLHAIGFKVQTMIDRNRSAGSAFGVDIVPALFLVDSNEIIGYSRSGELSYGAMEKALLLFLGENTAPEIR